MGIQKRPFGKTLEGVTADLYTLTNKKGTIIEITNFGGIIVSWKVADRSGKQDDIALGFGSLDGYLKTGPYFGAIIGRHGNRIENSEFELNGVTYHLAKNDGNNNLHGGTKGFDKALFKGEIVSVRDGEALQLTYRSKDGEEGFPGNLDVKVIYTLTEENELVIDYSAVSDKDTVINLTNHTYFNLKGHACGDVLDHQLSINADKMTKINNEGIPTGEFMDVSGTPFDFRKLTLIGSGISADDEQIANGKGYDHNWVLKVSGKKPEKAAEVYEPVSGRFMEVFTTKPGIQFYSGNFLAGVPGKENAVYQKRSGLCLETQYFPNAMKHKHFPSPILKAGEEYRYTTIYKFSCK